ncbi:MAG TPA: hypothetical protein VKQ29_17795 [Aliidongia sp.]|nr:hypothetical protein [Aliidongia sp.]
MKRRLVRALAALPPGSFLWLLQHELRLRLRTNPSWMNAPILGITSALLHLLGLMTALGVSHLPGQPKALTLTILTILLLSTLLFMLSTTLVTATQALYERGDMDLLLSSPLSRRTILWVRAGAMAASLVAGSGFLLWPIANGFILFGYAGAFAAYLWVPALALFATGLGIALTLALFRLVGPRRTRLVAQIIGVSTGIGFAVVFQGPNLLSAAEKQALFQRLAASARATGPLDGLLWLPGRAAMGEAGPLAVLLAAGGGLFALVVWSFARRFTGAVTAAGGATATTRRRSRARRFRGGTLAILRAKELRLLARDPWLLTQMSQQVVAILPMGFLLFRHQMGFGSLAWLILVAAAGVISGGLVWLAVVGEEVPDLLASAPLRPRAILGAKLQAAYLPVATFVLPLAFVAGTGPGGVWLGLTLAACSAGAGLSVGMLDLQYAVPAKRGDFRLRHRGRVILGAAELLLALAWVGVATLMLAYSIWALILGIVLLAPVPGGLTKFGRADRAGGTGPRPRLLP